MLLASLALVSGLAFLYYGVGVLVRVALHAEFERYGMPPSIRVVVGVAELLGGTGVLLGLVYPALGALAALGLLVLMVLGLAVRVRLGDPPRVMAPAAVLAVVNAVLIVLFMRG